MFNVLKNFDLELREKIYEIHKKIETEKLKI